MAHNHHRRLGLGHTQADSIHLLPTESTAAGRYAENIKLIITAHSLCQPHRWPISQPGENSPEAAWLVTEGNVTHLKEPRKQNAVADPEGIAVCVPPHRLSLCYSATKKSPCCLDFPTPLGQQLQKYPFLTGKIPVL